MKYLTCGCSVNSDDDSAGDDDDDDDHDGVDDDFFHKIVTILVLYLVFVYFLEYLFACLCVGGLPQGTDRKRENVAGR